jgi:branched-chain amino acid transport system permease protein
MMHAPLWRARVLSRLVPAYLLALTAGLIMLAGASLLIEMAYHLSTKASEGPMMSFMHVPFSANSILPWLVAAVLLAGGYFFFRSVWPYVEGAWHDALLKACERGSAT